MRGKGVRSVGVVLGLGFGVFRGCLSLFQRGGDCSSEYLGSGDDGSDDMRLMKG